MIDTKKLTVSGDDDVRVYDVSIATRTQKGNNAKDTVGADKDSGSWDGGQPFCTTHLGKVPPEIREKIFINLLALPPPFAGRNIAKQDTGTGHDLADNGHGKSSNTPCYHLKGSWLKTLQTCRQIYLEAFPVFYGRKSYYAANAQELVTLFKFGSSGASGPLAFLGDGVTSLCVKGLVRYTTGTGWGALEGVSTCISLDHTTISATSELQGWKNLRKISLCMATGEEDFYLIFLFRLSGLEYGVVEAQDESHWSIHPQYRGSEWNIQYAICTHNSGDLENVSEDKITDCRRKTYSDLYASGLKSGDERYVEVDIIRGGNPEYMTDEEIKAAIESNRDRKVADTGTTETSHAQSRAMPHSRKRRVCCWPFSSS